MPTYQYVCQACGEQFERVQAFSDPSLTEHSPGCGGPVRKRFGNIGVVFKGSGFYRNDARGPDKAEGGDGAKESKADGAKEAKADAKGGGSKGESKGDGAKSDGAKSDTAPAAKPAGEKGSTGGKSAPASTPKAPAASKA